MEHRNFSFGARPLSDAFKARMDPRIRERIEGWSVHYVYKRLSASGVMHGDMVSIPDVWDSKCYCFQYCEIYKTDESEANPGEAESEIQAYVGLGWPSCDFEVIIGLRIAGKDVYDPNGKVMCEIMKVSGARDFEVRYKGKFMTNFKQYALWGRFFETEKSFVSMEVK
jgi:hypothetical protein